jgi:hypothetical protein
MMFCPRCNAEYRSGFTRCSECDIPLVYRFPVQPVQPFEDEQPQLILLRTYSNDADASLAKSVLEAAGIDSVVKSPNDFRMSRFFGYEGTDVYVRSEDAEDANEVLVQALRAEPSRDE